MFQFPAEFQIGSLAEYDREALLLEQFRSVRQIWRSQEPTVLMIRTH